MSKKKDNLCGRRIDFNWKQRDLEKQGISREHMIPVLRPISDQIMELEGKILGGGNGPDPGPDPAAIRRLFQIDAMGFFLNFGDDWWAPVGRSEALEWSSETLEKFMQYGPSAINYFLWVQDGTPGNQHYFKQCPYVRRPDGLYDLSQIREKFLRCVEDWTRMMLRAGADPLVCLFMARYCDFPFENNANGVRGFWDPAALEFQVLLANAVLKVLREVLGDTYPLKMRFVNEAAHSGSHEMLHILMNWNRDLFLESDLVDDVLLTNLFFDGSLSEATYAEFVEEQDCPKWNPERPVPYCNGRIGGKITDKRLVQVVNHGFSIPEDIEGSGLQAFLGSAWRPPSSWWPGGDGGAKEKDLANGYKIRAGGAPEGRVIFAQGDAQQTHDLAHELFLAGKKRGKNVGYQLTFFETLQGWPLMENYRKSVIEWSRPDAVRMAHDEVFGAPK